VYPASALIEWNKTFGGTRYDLGTGIKITEDGGYVFVGIKDAAFYDDGGDCWLVKIDGNGNIQWEKTFGGRDSEIAADVCCTNDNGYAIAYSTRSFGAGDMDVGVIKTDANGNEQWNTTYGGTGHDQATSILQTSDTGYIVSGMTKSFGDNEAWLFKIDQDGDLQWNKTYGDHDDTGEYFMEVLQTTDGGFIAAGRNYLSGGANSDMYVVRTDAAGEIVWEKQLGGPFSDGCLGITQTTDGGYCLTGQSSPSMTTLEDISLFKIDSMGNELWSRFYGSPFFDTGASVIQWPDGGYLIAGEYSRSSRHTDAILLKTDAEGNREWDAMLGGEGSDGFLEAVQTADGGVIVIGFTESFGAGDSDIWVVKFSAFGNQPPVAPTITGPAKGKVKVAIDYNFTTIDPEGDEVTYCVDWGDGTNSSWICPAPSGGIIVQSHTWQKKGAYLVKAKAKDSSGAESDWGSLDITMPCSSDMRFQPFWEWLFDRFPACFPLLRALLQRVDR